MFRNYLVVALRHLRSAKLYSILNIGGLAVGLAACLMILLFVRDELSYDRWLPNAERIAKLETIFKIPDRDSMEFGTSPGPAKALLESDFSSDIERAVRILRFQVPVRVGERQFSERIAYVDPGFFSVFDLPVVAGDRDAALADNGSLLVSERLATKLFGDQPAVGQLVTVDGEIDFRVVGVFADLPRNTHLDLDLIALLDPERYAEQPMIPESWVSANLHTYILFRSPEAMARVEGELPAFVDRHATFPIPGFENAVMSELLIFELMPLLDIHLHASKSDYLKEGGDLATVITFAAIAALILLIACINFVNLTTARSMKRAREVAMRKVLGATRRQLIGQFLGEAVLTALIALVVAVALVELALAPYNQFLDKELALDFIADPALAGLALALVLSVGVLGGAYPALQLSRFRPASVLKANQSSASGSTALRNTLVVFQFAVSIGLIISTAVVYSQMNYARGFELGYDHRDKLVIFGLRHLPSEEGAATLKRELAALGSVERVALSSDSPPLVRHNNSLLYPGPVIGDERFLIESLRVDHDFFQVYGIEPVAGRVFSAEIATDALREPENPDEAGGESTQSIVINETSVASLGFSSAAEAVGATFWDLAEPGSERLIRTTIIGVVPDVHLRSLRYSLTPMLFYLDEPESGSFNGMTVEVVPGQMSAAVAGAEELWSRMAPGVPIRTAFVDQEIAAQYDAVERRGHMFGAFAVFAVLIACLGLFGLAAFAAERRTVEIGIRKALGATVIDIVRLLMWQFSQPVLIANLIAWPTAYLLMSRWLASFEYRVDIGQPLFVALVFGGAGAVSLAIAWATVAGQAARVARASPVHAFRSD